LDFTDAFTNAVSFLYGFASLLFSFIY
jgi:hypothetical protein